MAIPRNHEREAVMVAAYEAGASLSEVAKRFGTSTQPVRDALAFADVARRRRGRPSGSYLDVSLARRLRAQGLSWRDVGARLGVPYGTVYAALRESAR